MLQESLDRYLKHNETGTAEDTLDPTVTAYLLVAWMVESSSACNGFGFPFDQPHLEFYLRLKEAYPTLNRLKDKGVSELPLTIMSRVKRFRHSARIVALSSSDTRYRKMVNQIDRYWDKLFANPIEADTPAGKITLQPQRTNNLLEQSFRFLKRDNRKRNG